MNTPPMTTRQGVRNLNGPELDGRNHNGRRQSCEHFKNPETPTYTEDRIMAVKTEYVTTERLTRCHVCVFCGEVRFTDAED